ncbi:hypothetical protein [Polymorphobacter sp.]|uniref:hypothetical protein n=1 Tax=Polymorphobacter sp. TaxID=1909290 RepID=UPI003F6F02E1
MSRKAPADAEPTVPMPAWFDPAVHSVGSVGIIETATGTLLADDGEPASKAHRLARRREREEAAAAAAAPTEGVTDAS